MLTLYSIYALASSSLAERRRAQIARKTKSSIFGYVMSEYPVIVGDRLPGKTPEGSFDILETYLQRYDRPATRRAYKNDLSLFFGTDQITIDAIRKVSFVTVNEYIKTLEEENASAATIKRKVSAIRGFFDWLTALKVIDSNPAHKQLVRRVKSVSQESSIIFLTQQQAADLIDAAGHNGTAAVRDRALILTMIHCVLRRSEVVAMDVEHIRPLGHYWVLDLPNTKGGADQYLKIPAHVVDEIDVMKAHYGIGTGALWRSLSNNSRGKRLNDRTVYKIVNRLACQAGLYQNIGAHTLRHTGCTLAIESGATLQQVQTHARHKNIETTMMYIHQRDRLRDSAADFIHIKK